MVQVGGCGLYMSMYSSEGDVKKPMVGRTQPTRRLDVELIRQPLARGRASRLELSANFYRK